MSLYRNWRPRSFADLVGQDTVVRTLSQALNSGRLVHAYLFSGPRGSGKTSAAKIFARCITCEAGPTPVPDNTCVHCRAIFDGTALDVVEIDAASNRGIDEIRALRDAVKFAPSTMRKKVYIIDEAHMLTKEGANAFLKTLEEPPAHVVFILATTAPESLPVTILSRCQRFAFRRISTAVMVERMRQIADAEGIAIEDSALGTIAYRADGGLRDALTMLEQAASFAEGTIDSATIETAFGASGRVFAGAILDAFILSDAVAVLRAIEEASDAGTEMNNLIRSLIAELRHVVVARIDPALLAGDLVEEDAARVRFRTEQLPQARALRALRLLADALAQARTSGNPRLELESAMLRLTLQGEDPTLEALASRVRQLEELLASGAGASTVTVPAVNVAKSPVAKSVPKGSPPQKPQSEIAVPVAAQAEIVVPVQAQAEAVVPVQAQTETAVPAETQASVLPEALKEEPTLQRTLALWPNIVARAEGKIASLRGPLSRAAVESVEGWNIVLQMGDEHNASILRSRLAILETAVAEVLGGACRILLRVGSGTQQHSAKKRSDKQAETPLGLLDYAAQRLGT